MVEAATHFNVLEGLSDDDIARVAGVCEEASYEPDTTIFDEGEEGEELFIVLSGRVRISKTISLDLDRTLATLGTGGVFGELAMVGEGTRSATAIALEPTRVLRLSKDGFQSLTLEAPTLGLQVMGRFSAMLADRLRMTTDLLRDTVHWGLEVSGASSLDFHRVIDAQANLEVSLLSGEKVNGRLLKVDRNEGGTLLTLSSAGEVLHLIPFHAVAAMRLSKSVLATEED